MPLIHKLRLNEEIVVNGATIRIKWIGTRKVELAIFDGDAMPSAKPEPGVPEAMKEIFGDGNE